MTITAISTDTALLICLASALAIALATIAYLTHRLAVVKATARTAALKAAEGERVRIERDLHDGAQQRLISLRIKVQLAQETIADDPAQATETLKALDYDVEATIDSIRSLARGIHPSVLASNGLPTALRAAALDAGVHVTILPGGTGRYPAEIESAVYFCCAEALQNAAKHSGAGAVAIALDPLPGGALGFEVRDDGRGFDAATAKPGAGLRNLRDRLAAVGGQVTITSAPGQGTIVAGKTGRPTTQQRAVLPSRA